MAEVDGIEPPSFGSEPKVINHYTILQGTGSPRRLLSDRLFVLLYSLGFAPLEFKLRNYHRRNGGRTGTRTRNLRLIKTELYH